MPYLIDTNVLSELRKKQPDAHVVAWMTERPRQSLYLSVLTLGEIRKGVEQMPDSARKLSLLDWLTVELPNYFVGRLLTVDADVADQWGHLSAKAGRPLAAIDALLAATALQHRLTLVTRNTRDFEGVGVDVINPWEEDADLVQITKTRLRQYEKHPEDVIEVSLGDLQRQAKRDISKKSPPQRKK